MRFHLANFVHAISLIYLLVLKVNSTETLPQLTRVGNRFADKTLVSGSGKSAPTILLMQWLGPTQYPPYYGPSDSTPLPPPVKPPRPIKPPWPIRPPTTPPDKTTRPPVIKPPDTGRPPLKPLSWLPPWLSSSLQTAGLQACESDPMVITVPQSSYFRSNLRLPKDKKVMEMVGLMFLVPVETLPSGQPTKWVTIPLVDPLAPYSRNPYRPYRPVGAAPDLQKPKPSGSIYGGMGHSDKIALKNNSDEKLADFFKNNYKDMMSKMPVNASRHPNPAQVLGFPSQREMLLNFLNAMKSEFYTTPSPTSADDYSVRFQLQNENSNPAMSASDTKYHDLMPNLMTKINPRRNFESGGTDKLLNYSRKKPAKNRVSYAISTSQWPSRIEKVSIRDRYGIPQMPRPVFYSALSTNNSPAKSNIYIKILAILSQVLPTMPLNLARDLALKLSEIPEDVRNFASYENRKLGQDSRSNPFVYKSDDPIKSGATQSTTDDFDVNRAAQPGELLETFVLPAANGNENAGGIMSATAVKGKPFWLEIANIDKSVPAELADGTAVYQQASTDKNQMLAYYRCNASHYNLPNSSGHVPDINSSLPYVWNIRGSINYFNFPHQKMDSVPGNTSNFQSESNKTSSNADTHGSHEQQQAAPGNMYKQQTIPEHQLPTISTLDISDFHYNSDSSSEKKLIQPNDTNSNELPMDFSNKAHKNVIPEDIPQSPTSEKETSFVWHHDIPKPPHAIEQPFTLSIPSKNQEFMPLKTALVSTLASLGKISTKHQQDAQSSKISETKAGEQRGNDDGKRLIVHWEFLNNSDPSIKTNMELFTNKITLPELTPDSRSFEIIEKTMDDDEGRQEFSVQDDKYEHSLNKKITEKSTRGNSTELLMSSVQNLTDKQFKYPSLPLNVTNFRRTHGNIIPKHKMMLNNDVHGNQPKNFKEVNFVKPSNITAPIPSALQDKILSKDSVLNYQSFKEFLLRGMS